MAEDSTVEVCVIPLAVDAAERAALWDLLDPHEQARARRFRAKAHADRFVVAHGRLRQALASRTGGEPAGLRFAANPAGKPHLIGGRIHFSLSHSQDLAVVAMAAFELGVDIEADQGLERPGIAAFFAPCERARLQPMDDDAWRAAVLRGWTRKEAVSKALGCGLALPFSSFSVSLLADEPPALLHMDGDPDAAAVWRIQDIRPAPGFYGAIAARRAGWTVESGPQRWPAAGR